MPGPAPTLYPLLRYEDAPAAIAWLKDAFGFQEHQVVANEDGTIAHAELTYGSSVLMLGSDRDDALLGRRAGLGWIYVAVDDPDAIASAPARRAPTTARANTPLATWRATCGASGPIAWP